MNGTLQETEDGFTVVDQYGDTWDVFVDDAAGNYAIERDAGDRWVAAEFSGGVISPSHEGSTFGVNCQEEFVVTKVDNAGSLRWTENEGDE